MSAREALWDLAVDRYGYVTIRDAHDLGIADMTLQMLVARGKLERAAHGVYRFPELPVSEYDSYMRAVLWTGEPTACLSHETALANYDVSDINPNRMHLTVPKDRRIRRSGGEFYELHREDVPESEIGWWHRIRMVKLPTAIRQCAETGVPTYLIRQAVEQGHGRGLLLRAEVDELTARLGDRDDR